MGFPSNDNHNWTARILSNLNVVVVVEAAVVVTQTVWVVSVLAVVAVLYRSRRSRLQGSQGNRRSRGATRCRHRQSGQPRSPAGPQYAAGGGDLMPPGAVTLPWTQTHPAGSAVPNKASARLGAGPRRVVPEEGGAEDNPTVACRRCCCLTSLLPDIAAA